MYKYLILCLFLFYTNNATANLYRSMDSKGTLIFSDLPINGSKNIVLTKSLALAQPPTLIHHKTKHLDHHYALETKLQLAFSKLKPLQLHLPYHQRRLIGGVCSPFKSVTNYLHQRMLAAQLNQKTATCMVN